MRAGRFEAALPLAEKAVAGKVECTPAHGLLATILLQLGRQAQADAVIESALGLATGIADAYDALAYVSLNLGSHERANALYRRAVELGPDTPRLWYNLASSERSFGRLAEAETACDRAIALDAREYPSYLLRSELRVQTPEANHVEELRRALARPALEGRARVCLGYALGKELDDLRQYDEAFRWFSEAASTRRRHLAYDVAVDERKLLRIAEVFPRQSSRPNSAGNESRRFIFIVGLPRSGTTLLERILTNLPGVRSNGETDFFARALLAASPAEDAPGSAARSDVFERAASADPAAVAARYAKLSGAERSGGLILEKLPMNYLYLGAIQRALPAAGLLLVTRAPLDSCFAMYRTLFGEAYPFSYDLQDLARYYAAYARLMEHWRATLGGALHEVSYEQLVSDPIGTGSAAARACGLPWRDEAIAVERNSAVSLTASAAQVRRPIYGSSSGRWRHYRAHLLPLIEGLRRRQMTLPDGA
ncbi:MAG: sulfotransferase [Steroidobacteraceae bacterium]